MIRGIGLDLIDLERFGVLYGAFDPAVLARCFTQTELVACGAGLDRLARLAARFCAKEAAYKALGGVVGASLTDVEVVADGGGVPQIALHRAAASAVAELGIVGMLLSLTHSDRSAAAVVIAI